MGVFTQLLSDLNMFMWMGPRYWYSLFSEFISNNPILLLFILVPVVYIAIRFLHRLLNY